MSILNTYRSKEGDVEVTYQQTTGNNGQTAVIEAEFRSKKASFNGEASFRRTDRRDIGGCSGLTFQLLVSHIMTDLDAFGRTEFNY